MSHETPPRSDDYDVRRRFALRRLRQRLFDSEEAEDAAQEVMIRFVRYERRGKPIENEEALLTTLADRVAVDFNRRRTHGPAVERIDPDAVPVQPVLSWERRRFVALELMRRHAPDCGGIVRLILEGWARREIATKLGIEYDALRQRLARCYAKVRDACAEDPHAREWFDD